MSANLDPGQRALLRLLAPMVEQLAGRMGNAAANDRVPALLETLDRLGQVLEAARSAIAASPSSATAEQWARTKSAWASGPP